MPAKGFGSGLLVLVELGATFPRSFVEGSTHVSCRVLVEREGEGPGSFGARVQAAAGSLFPRGVSLGAVVIACNERADEGAMGARRTLSHWLLGRRSLSRIVFSPPERTRESFQRSLGTLVAELSRVEPVRASLGPAQGDSNRLPRVA